MTEKPSILIIDDSEDDRLLYRRALQKSTGDTYDIIEADDGDRGLDMIGEHPPTCVLLDYSLPGRNGIEVLKRIRVKHAFVPVVMLTGQGNEAIAVTAMQEGAQNYIAKNNITPDAIQRVIRVAIEHCALEKRIHEQRTSLEIFTRALAHDLKEPVRTIRSFLDLLVTRETFSSKGQGYFDYIRKAADRMGTLIDTVYFYTRLDGPPQQLAKEACDVAGVLEEAKENIGQLIKERQATITSDPLPKINVNHMQLLQVLQNLLCNAIRHGGDHPKVHVHASEVEGQWLFRVSDDGPGIDEPYRVKLFQPFKRGNHHKGQGLGLGLAICKKIVESHGGKIWYEPGIDAGATFLFTLPKDMPKQPRVKHGAAQQPLPKKPADGYEKPLANILLVEDNEADIELTRILLIEQPPLKCNFLVAHDAYEALTMLRAETQKTGAIDLMLLDINMPGMDGFDLLEQIRNEDSLKKTLVVMCSTSTYDKDIERAKSLGVVGYMSKPAEIGKLKAILAATDSLRLQAEQDGYALLRAA